MAAWLLGVAMALIGLPGSGGSEEAALRLIPDPETRTAFTNGVLHYVYFDVEAPGRERITLQLISPEGKETAFRTRQHVNMNQQPVLSARYDLKEGQTRLEGMNVLFRSKTAPGVWQIRVTASVAGEGDVTETIPVTIRNLAPETLQGLEAVHGMIRGIDGGEMIPAEAGTIRYISQNPSDRAFVKDYWVSSVFDLRPGANEKCTRVVFSMALGYLGIDCTPIRMTDMTLAVDMDYTYDPVCRKLGNVVRQEGDLETLWARYEAGEGSPVYLHFRYEGGMHAVLLVARDRENPDLFYTVTSAQRIDTSAYPGGRERDPVVPLILEEGDTGGLIQSPLMPKYHKGVIDRIWQWTRTD